MNKIWIVNKMTASVLLGTLIVVFVCGCGSDTASYMEGQKEDILLDEKTDEALQEDETLVQDDESDNKQICIYICGAVQSPGVYNLPEGSRVCDLFKMAGGLLENAAVDYWNQAKVLSDGEMIYVPTIDEVGNRQLSQNIGTTYDDGKININSATKEELMTLPGIGESKALAIISYREKNGQFSSISDIKKVEGIKEGLFSKIENYIKIN